MATVREIERRIRSVKNIAQVTRALEAVSASKVRKAQTAVINTRPYAHEAWRVLTDLSKQAGAGANLHPLLTERPVNSIDLIVITSDRGLCGAFNYNVIRAALEFVNQQTVPVNIVSVGRKGRELLFRAEHRRRVQRPARRAVDFGRQPDRPHHRRRFSHRPCRCRLRRLHRFRQHAESESACAASAAVEPGRFRRNDRR